MTEAVLPPYIYGREAGPDEKVWTEAAVRVAIAADRASRWVAVGEPAPVNVDLLLTLSTGKVVVGWRYPEFWDWADTDDDEDDDASVIHWQRFPLPAAPDAVTGAAREGADRG